MLSAYSTQETEAPTKGLTPNLAFPLKLLRSQPARINPGINPDINPGTYSNTFQSDTSKLNADDRTANGQAVKCINGGATTVSVTFYLRLIVDTVNLQPYDLTLTLELGSINDQGVYTLTQAYTGDKLGLRFVDPQLYLSLGPRRVFVFEYLEIKDAKATQNLVIRLTEERKYINGRGTNSLSTVSILNFNATFPQPLQS